MSTSQYPLNIWVESQNQYAPSVAFPLPVNVVGGNLVSQIIPGTGVTISPTTGIGAVTISATGTTGGGVTGIEDGTTNVVTGAVQIKSADTNLTVVGNPTTNVMTLTNAAPCNATTVAAAGAAMTAVGNTFSGVNNFSGTATPTVTVTTTGGSVAEVVTNGSNGVPAVEVASKVGTTYYNPGVGFLAPQSGNSSATYLLSLMAQTDTAAHTLLLPTGGGTLATTGSLSSYATLAGTQTFTGANTFSSNNVVNMTTPLNQSVLKLTNGSGTDLPPLLLQNFYSPDYYQTGIRCNVPVGSDGSTTSATVDLKWPIEASTTSQTLTLPAGSGTLISTANIASNAVSQIIAGTGISVSSGTGSVTITNTSGGYTLDNSSTPITSSSSDTHVPSSENVYNNTLNPAVIIGVLTFAFPSTPGMYQNTAIATGIMTGNAVGLVIISGLNTTGRTAAYFVLNFLDASNNVWSAQVQALSSVLGNQVSLIWGTLPTNVGITIYAGSQSTGTMTYGLTNNYGTTISNVMAGIKIYTY